MTATDNTLSLKHEQAAAAPRFRWLIAPLTAFLVTRIAIFGIVLLADLILPGFNGIHVFQSGNPSADYVNAWDRWDTPFYTDIAEHGYSYVPGDDRNNVVFYPLYPISIAALSPIVGGNGVLAGLLISNVAFFTALLILYQLIMLKTGDESLSARTIFYLAAFPEAFFFAAAYTESLFLLLTVAAAYLALRRQWGWAGLMGILASATRATGFLLVILVGYEWLQANGWTFSQIRERAAWDKLLRAIKAHWLELIPIILIPVGLLLYMAYLGHAFGDPLAGFESQAGWRQPSNVISFFNDMKLLLAGKLWPSYIMDTICFFVVMALIIPIGRRFGAGYALYTAFALLIPATSGVMSITRFTTVLFPVFMIAALLIRSERFDRLIRVVFLLFLAIFALAFVKNVFLG
ncbi:MAG TPA: mannosyltransferase family protein [Phototrophicaceae bacterium]|nr:mannosyltransferase family protein [Phototrophicaceae bacterium]